MSTVRRPTRNASRRRGNHALELAFAVPVMVLLFAATMIYGKLLTVNSGVAQATTVGAREAGKGGNVADVAEAINRVLAACGIQVSGHAGSGAKVVLQDGTGGTSACGDPALPSPPPVWLAADEVCVTVLVAPGARSLAGTALATRSVVKKESRGQAHDDRGHGAR